MNRQLLKLMILIATILELKAQPIPSQQYSALDINLSSYDVQIIAYAVKHKLPDDLMGIDDLRYKSSMGQRSYTLPEIIRIMIALNRLQDPEANELLTRIKSRFPAAK